MFFLLLAGIVLLGAALARATHLLIEGTQERERDQIRHAWMAAQAAEDRRRNRDDRIRVLEHEVLPHLVPPVGKDADHCSACRREVKALALLERKAKEPTKAQIRQAEAAGWTADVAEIYLWSTETPYRRQIEGWNSPGGKWQREFPHDLFPKKARLHSSAPTSAVRDRETATWHRQVEARLADVTEHIATINRQNRCTHAAAFLPPFSSQHPPSVCPACGTKLTGN